MPVKKISRRELKEKKKLNKKLQVNKQNLFGICPFCAQKIEFGVDTCENCGEKLIEGNKLIGKTTLFTEIAELLPNGILINYEGLLDSMNHFIRFEDIESIELVKKSFNRHMLK